MWNFFWKSKLKNERVENPIPKLSNELYNFLDHIPFENSYKQKISLKSIQNLRNSIEDQSISKYFSINYKLTTKSFEELFLNQKNYFYNFYLNDYNNKLTELKKKAFEFIDEINEFNNNYKEYPNFCLNFSKFEEFINKFISENKEIKKLIHILENININKDIKNINYNQNFINFLKTNPQYSRNDEDFIEFIEHNIKFKTKLLEICNYFKNYQYSTLFSDTLQLSQEITKTLIEIDNLLPENSKELIFYYNINYLFSIYYIENGKNFHLNPSVLPLMDFLQIFKKKKIGEDSKDSKNFLKKHLKLTLEEIIEEEELFKIGFNYVLEVKFLYSPIDIAFSILKIYPIIKEIYISNQYFNSKKIKISSQILTEKMNEAYAMDDFFPIFQVLISNIDTSILFNFTPFFRELTDHTQNMVFSHPISSCSGLLDIFNDAMSKNDKIKSDE